MTTPQRGLLVWVLAVLLAALVGWRVGGRDRPDLLIDSE